MIKERVIQLLEYKKIPKEVFCKKIGMTSASFRGSAKKTPLNSTAIENILSEIPDINPEWLLKGGNIPMLKTNGIVAFSKIPLYDNQAVSDPVTLFDDDFNLVPSGYISIPDLPRCDGAIRVAGDSMYPFLKAGDIVLYKIIVPSIENVFWGEMYVLRVETDKDVRIMTKWVRKSERGEDYIKLMSENEEYEPKDIPIGHVTGAALVKGSIRING